MPNDLSYLILEQMQNHYNVSVLNEQDVHILNEGFKDFFVSIKNMPIERINKIVSAKYQELETAQKRNDDFLKRNKVNINKLTSITNNIILRYKSKLAGIGKRRDGNALSRLTKEIGEKVKSELEEKKNSWFNLKYWDPAQFAGPLFLSLLLITVKAFLLVLLISFFPITGGLSSAVFHLIFVFIIMPCLEERARFMSTNLGTGGAFTVIFNMADFALMFVTKILASGFVGILAFILVRMFTAAIHAGNWYIQKMGYMTDEAEVSFRISWCLNAIRTYIEITIVTAGSILGH